MTVVKEIFLYLLFLFMTFDIHLQLLSPDIIPSGWLGSKHQVTSWLTFSFTCSLTMGIISAPQMISQPVFSIFLFSTALWDHTNSRPVHSLMVSSHLCVCLVFFPLSLCLTRWLWPDLMNWRADSMHCYQDHNHTVSNCCEFMCNFLFSGVINCCQNTEVQETFPTFSVVRRKR